MKLSGIRPEYSFCKKEEKDMEKTKKVPANTITRDVRELAAPTGNIYESVSSRRYSRR